MPFYVNRMFEVVKNEGNNSGTLRNRLSQRNHTHNPIQQPPSLFRFRYNRKSLWFSIRRPNDNVPISKMSEQKETLVNALRRFHQHLHKLLQSRNTV